MKKIIIGFVIGFTLAALLAIPVIIFERNDRENFGRVHGQTDGELLVFEFLSKHFEADEYPEEYIDIYGIKDVVIYVVDKGGQKTVETKFPTSQVTLRDDPPR